MKWWQTLCNTFTRKLERDANELAGVKGKLHAPPPQPNGKLGFCTVCGAALNEWKIHNCDR